MPMRWITERTDKACAPALLDEAREDRVGTKSRFVAASAHKLNVRAMAAEVGHRLEGFRPHAPTGTLWERGSMILV
jgi:hypothetical protein